MLRAAHDMSKQADRSATSKARSSVKWVGSKMDEGLTRRAVEVNWRSLALGHHVSRFDGATFVRNPTLPDIYDANFVFGITASETAAIDRLLTRAAREYAHAPRLTFRVDPFTPPTFEAQLALQGYERSETVLLLLDGPIRRAANRFEILPIEDEAGWVTMQSSSTSIGASMRRRGT